MGLKHTKEVREALPAKQVEANGTSKITAKCNCSPCNCNPCKCPEKSINTNGSSAPVHEEKTPCQESPCQESKDVGNEPVVDQQDDSQCQAPAHGEETPCQEPKEAVNEPVVEQQGDSQCHAEREVNADEESAQDPPPQQVNEVPTPEAEDKPVEKDDEAATSPVIEGNNEDSTQAQDQAGGTEIVASEQQ